MMAAHVLMFISRSRASLPELSTYGRCEDVSLFGLRSRHTDPVRQSAYRLPDLCRIVCYCPRRQSFLQLAAKFAIRPNPRAEVSRDVTPYLLPEDWRVTVSVRLQRPTEVTKTIKAIATDACFSLIISLSGEKRASANDSPVVRFIAFLSAW